MKNFQSFNLNEPLKIHIVGDSILRTKTKSIVNFDQNLIDFSKKMTNTMYTQKGIGLAAPQIGYSFKICVIDVSPCLSGQEKCIMDTQIVSDITTIMPICLINPIITWQSQDFLTIEEGCLSIPNFSANVSRPKEISVLYYDSIGNKHTIQSDGIFARCMQHEIDHLNGVLYTDLVKQNDRFRFTKYIAAQG